MSAPYDPNVYAPPPPPPTWTPTPESRVQGPAIAVIVSGSIGALMWLVQIVAAGVFMALGSWVAMTDPQLQNDPGATMMLGGLGLFGIVSRLIPFVINLVVIWGGWKMLHLESYAFAMAAAIISIIPMCGCCLVSTPVGIWALITLQEPIVRDNFRA